MEMSLFFTRVNIQNYLVTVNVKYLYKTIDTCSQVWCQLFSMIRIFFNLLFDLMQLFFLRPATVMAVVVVEVAAVAVTA